jgi:hypothetical protein
MYTKNQSGEDTVFDVSPTLSKVPLLILGWSAIPCAIVSVFFGYISWFLFWVVFAASNAGCIYLYRRFILDKYRAPKHFAVSQRAVTVNDIVLPVADVHRLVARNHMFADVEKSGALVYESGTTAAGGFALRTHYSKNCWRVDVEARGTPHTLAGGLTEPEAFAIMEDMKRAMGQSGGVAAHLT